MNPSAAQNVDMISSNSQREESHNQEAARKVPGNERNRHGGLLFNSHNRATTTVEECDTDSDQQQNLFLNRLH